MKFTLLFSLIFGFCLPCFSQKNDTIRIYDYLKLADSWKLKTRSNGTFRLYTNKFFKKDDIIIRGRYIPGETTLQFLCDTTKLKNRNLAGERLKRFSNIPFILTGEVFARQNEVLIPHNIEYYAPEDSLIMPNGIFARYFRGDGYGNYIIELKEDSTYIFIDASCTMRDSETGTWKLSNGVITFTPENKEWTRLDWVTQNKMLYLTTDYLIGLKTSTRKTILKKLVVTETYYFLSKEPVYSWEQARTQRRAMIELKENL